MNKIMNLVEGEVHDYKIEMEKPPHFMRLKIGFYK